MDFYQTQPSWAEPYMPSRPIFSMALDSPGKGLESVGVWISQAKCKTGGLKISRKSDMQEKIYGKFFIPAQNKTFTLTKYNTHLTHCRSWHQIRRHPRHLWKEDTEGHCICQGKHNKTLCVLTPCMYLRYLMIVFWKTILKKHTQMKIVISCQGSRIMCASTFLFLIQSSLLEFLHDQPCF